MGLDDFICLDSNIIDDLGPQDCKAPTFENIDGLGLAGFKISRF